MMAGIMCLATSTMKADDKCSDDPMFDLLLPLISIVATGVMFVADETHRQQAQRLYFFTLVLVLICTAITVVGCDGCWLIHTTTLGMMVIAAFLVPNAQPQSVHAVRFAGSTSDPNPESNI